MDDTISVLNGEIKLSYNWIIQKCKPKDEDSILVGGTLIEGMGNKESDLDIYVLTNELPSSNIFDISEYAEVTDSNDEAITDPTADISVYSLYDYIDGSKVHIDIKYIKIQRINEIACIINSSYDSHLHDSNIYYPTNELPLDYEDFMFFHRLLSSICIMGNIFYNSLKKSLPNEKFCLLSYSEHTLDYFSVKDIQGAIESDNLFLAREVTRELVTKQAQSLIFSYGVTNRNKKWINFYLEKSQPSKEIFHTFNKLMSLPTKNRSEIIYFVVESIKFIKTALEISHQSSLFNKFQDDIVILKNSLHNGYQSNMKKDHDIAQESYQIRLSSYEKTDLILHEIIFPS